MKYRGGYNLLLEGKPSAEIRELPEPGTLDLPLFSRRFTFDDLRIGDGQDVAEGDVLAADSANYGVPLLAPRAGTARLNAVRRHVCIESVKPASGAAIGDAGSGTDALVRLGAWSYFADAATGGVPDPAAAPKAIVVTTLHLDAFLVRGDVQLNGALEVFKKGLESIHALAEGAAFHLVVPRMSSDLAAQVKELAGGLSWLQVLEVDLRYPFGNCKLAAEQMGLGGGGAVWALGVEGVLAAERVLGENKPCTSRIISLGGPAAKEAVHAAAAIGYPVDAIREAYVEGDRVRIVNGGALSGAVLDENQSGIDVECLGLTMLPENTDREFLAFALPGFGKHAFTRTFASVLRPLFRERYTTALRGEHRPCVQCGSCSRACAAGLTPFLIAHLADRKRLDDAARIGLKKCLNCGLCSYVCLAKRENSQKIFDAIDAFRKEEEALAAHS